MARQLIVNADDFGRSAAINAGIVHAHQHGIVTSASLMVRYEHAAEAAAYANAGNAGKAARPLSLGLHLDLAEWEYVDDEWRPRYLVVDTDDEAAVEGEVTAQIDAFIALAGRPPTHLDSHQHVHRSEPVRSVVAAAADRLAVPVRDMTARIRYRGDFYGQDARGYPVPDAITAAALLELLDRLPEGTTELGCHPGLGPVDDVYGAEREIETSSLCEPAVRAAVDRLGIRLRSFADVDAADG